MIVCRKSSGCEEAIAYMQLAWVALQLEVTMQALPNLPSAGCIHHVMQSSSAKKQFQINSGHASSFQKAADSQMGENAQFEIRHMHVETLLSQGFLYAKVDSACRKMLIIHSCTVK